jgi:hypothetical protein
MLNKTHFFQWRSGEEFGVIPEKKSRYSQQEEV